MGEITGTTKVTGIIGYPLTYTLSPAMHNSAFKATGLDYRYLPFVVEETNLARAIEGVRALNIRGINVTMPHKEAVTDLLDELSSEARLIGAVNTIENSGGRLVGHNTDAGGFLRSLREESFEPLGKHAIVLGAGGAAKAVAVALMEAGAESIALVARSLEKADALKVQLERAFGEKSIKSLSFAADLADIFQVGDVVVNATPIGMKESGNLLPVPLELIESRHFIYDLVYVPLETALLKAANEKGAKVANGLGMLLYQAAAAFEIWTGTAAPIETMRHALMIGLEGGDRSKHDKEKDQRFST